MGKWCMLYGIGAADATPFKSEREETFQAFCGATSLPVDDAVRAAFTRFFNRTIGASLAAGVSWDHKDGALHQFRRIAQAAEATALATGVGRITADVFDRAAMDRLELVRRREMERVA